VKRGGDWDRYVILANRLHWTPPEVDAQDPDFLDELMAFWQAHADDAKAKQSKREQAAARSGGRRRR
jgi:hypothetical protein